MNTKEYYKDLSHIQNNPHWAHVDIMTITGFMNQDERRKHIIEKAAACADEQEIVSKWLFSVLND